MCSFVVIVDLTCHRFDLFLHCGEIFPTIKMIFFTRKRIETVTVTFYFIIVFKRTSQNTVREAFSRSYISLSFFSQALITLLTFIGVARIFDWVGPNHRSYAMTSSEIFKRGTFWKNLKPWPVLALNQDFVKGRELTLIVKTCKSANV